MLSGPRMQTYIAENSEPWRGAEKVSKSEQNFVTSKLAMVKNCLQFDLEQPTHFK